MLEAALLALDHRLPLNTPDRQTAALLEQAGREVVLEPLAGLLPLSVRALVLAADELSAPGDGAEGLISAAGEVLAPGGVLFVSARNPLHLPADSGLRGFLAAQLAAALSHRGFTIELLAAPGAAAAVTGTSPVDGRYDPERDRLPGLLDAAPRAVALGRAPASGAERSSVFFATLPRKVVAAAVLCRDPAGRVLIVHDSFRQHWTIPGGVVDADEDPRTAAQREAWEESGVRVTVGEVLAVFSSTPPDRLVFVFAAAPQEATQSPPRPVHAHEIDAAEWTSLDDALDRLAPYVAEQVTRAIRAPGNVWRQ